MTVSKWRLLKAQRTAKAAREQWALGNKQVAEALWTKAKRQLFEGREAA